MGHLLPSRGFHPSGLARWQPARNLAYGASLVRRVLLLPCRLEFRVPPDARSRCPRLVSRVRCHSRSFAVSSDPPDAHPLPSLVAPLPSRGVTRSRFQSPAPACACPSHSAIMELRLLERAACPRGYDSAHGIREAWKVKINISCHRSLLLRCRVVLRFDGARARRSLHQSGNTRSFNITICIIFVDHHHLNIRTFIIFVVVVVLLSERRAFASTSFHLLDR